ncbi:MAG: hypothetical protein LBP50_08450 [Tannerella sp.]|jgi:hypothetical protein|nr:hypothetical protein [Tannerella sp.]
MIKQIKTMEEQLKFEVWALVELFGHNQLSGKVSEQVIAGQLFVRIDVPATKKSPAFTKYHLPTAIYGITPVEEEYATRMAECIGAQPVNDYRHNQVIDEIIREKMKELQELPKDGSPKSLEEGSEMEEGPELYF